MIAIQDALNIIEKSVNTTSKTEVKKLSDALHYVLSEDVKSPIHMPPFRQSAMDGYALNLHDESKYTVVGEVKAGDNAQPEIKPGQAIRIFTGAPVPDSANAIIIQEHVEVKDNTIKAIKPVSVNANIRPLGEQVKLGEIALEKGTKLTSAAIGFLATLGITEVYVYSRPEICIIVTGNELIKPGEDLLYGQIFESNAEMLSVELSRVGFRNVTVKKVGDNYQRTVHILNSALSDHDLVIISGGISVGDYDYVREALTELGIVQMFYKVKQKPGKPLFFGKKENTVVFALPGNPASALSCFYIYVLKAIEQLSGNPKFNLNKVIANSKSHFIKKGDRPQFLKAIYENGNVKILDGQNSSMLHTFALSNALAFIPSEQEEININDKIEVILLPIN